MDLDSLKKFIESQRDQYVLLEKLLTSKKALAPENSGVGELEKCQALEDFLKSHGFKNLSRFDAKDSRVPSGARPNLIATVPGLSDDYNIWVIAHLDVVPAGNLDAWNTNPWEAVEKDGKIFGRGVEDNQQGLTSAFAATWAFLSNNEKPEHTVKLLFAADEEVGSKYGMIWLLENHPELFGKDDLFIIPDGGDSKGETIEVAEKNIMWIKFVLTGKQVHGSRPDLGVNACLAGSELSVKLKKALQKKFCKKDKLFTPPYSTFEPTMRKANVEGVNIIPGRDELYFDCRILPEYKCSQVQKVVERVVEKIRRKFNITVEYEFPQMQESPATPTDSPVVQKLKAALKTAHGIEGKTIGIGGGTVGAELRNKGYNCVVWSTLNDMAHLPNEYCVVQNIVKDAQTLAALFLQK